MQYLGLDKELLLLSYKFFSKYELIEVKLDQ